MRNILRFFAQEHLFGNLLTFLVIVAGLFSVTAIRRDIWPDVHFNISTVTAVLPGASPEQVEKLVLNPIESSIKEVDGIKKVLSTATESKAVIVIQIDDKARDPEQIEKDIETAVEQTEDLPTEVERPVIRHVEASQTPVIEITVAGGSDEIERKLWADFISDELTLVPEVARVVKQGDRKREYLVDVDPIKLSRTQVSFPKLIDAIRRQNVSVPGGTVDVSPTTEMLIRTEGQYESPESILNTVIQANDAGYLTRIGEVATVRERLADPDRLTRAFGKSSINLTVQKKANGDAINLVNVVKEKIADLQARLPESFSLNYSNDFSRYLRIRMDSLTGNLIMGLFLVLFILRIFLPGPLTFVVAMGIPFSMLAAMLVVYLLGKSLNVINMIGLIIVLGMLVDDAIVVAENIWRKIEDGMGIEDSIVNGAREVVVPITASVMTTVFAFAPMLFMTGIFGQFVFEIPFVVIIALIASLFEALIIMPSHFASWAVPFLKFEGGRLVRKAHWFDRIERKYESYIAWSLRRRYKMLGASIVLALIPVMLTVFAGRFILFPPEGVELFFISLEAPIGTKIETTEKLVKPIEDALAQLPDTELTDYVASVGIIQQEPNDPQTRRGSNFAHVRVGLTPESDRERTAADIVDHLRLQIGTPEGVEKISFEYARQGPPQGQPIAFTLWGEDFAEIEKLTEQIKVMMAEIPGVLDIRDSFLPGKTEWQVIPKPSQAAIFGLTADDIALSVRGAFEGVVASSVRKLDEEIDVRARLQQDVVDPKEKLARLRIGNNQGNLVQLASVADFKPVDTISAINHLDFRRSISIGAEVNLDITTPREATNVLKPKIEALLENTRGMGVTWGGEDKDTQESMESLFKAFAFAVMVIFSILIITFKNLWQPILVLTTIPMGFVGVMSAMLLHGRPFSFMSILGVVALAGVIVNNAIVLIDFVNSRRKQGEGLAESVVRASASRLRPIMLTSITTICGLMPTAYGETIQRTFGFGGGDPFIVPIALALGWGLLIGTILTVCIFPSFILILDDVRSLAGRIFKRKNKAAI